MKPRAFIQMCLVIGAIAGCGGGPQRTIGLGQASKTSTISKQELREKLDRFEYFFISTMKQTAEDIDAATEHAVPNGRMFRCRHAALRHSMR